MEYDKHADRHVKKHRKHDQQDDLARRRRASFKQYLRDLEEDLLEDEILMDEELDKDEQPVE